MCQIEYGTLMDVMGEWGEWLMNVRVYEKAS